MAETEKEFDELTEELINAPKVDTRKRRGNPAFSKPKTEVPVVSTEASFTPEELELDIAAEPPDVEQEAPALDPSKKLYVFVTYGKDTRLYLEPTKVNADKDKYLNNKIANEDAPQFRNRKFVTDDLSIAERIRKNPAFNRYVFEGSLPDTVKRKINLDKKYNTFDQFEHENEYHF